MKLSIKLWPLLVIASLCIQQCTLYKVKPSPYKFLPMYRITEQNISKVSVQLDVQRKKLITEIMEKPNDEKGLKKIERCEKFKHEVVTIKSDIYGLMSKLEQAYSKLNKRNSEQQKMKIGLALKNRLDKYNNFLQKHFSQYIKGFKHWGNRYKQLLTENELKNTPSFIDFYFKYASEQEARVTLSMIQLGILQEALEIQEKILKE